MSQDKHKIGKQIIKKILGERIEEKIIAFDEISPDFTNYIIDFVYGDLYNRVGLSDKYRELAAVACLIGQGNTGSAFKAHLHGMLNVGWTKKELTELLILLIGFVGFPKIVDAMDVLSQL